MTPAVREWLAAHGVANLDSVRRLETATTAELFAVDDLVLRWYAGGTFLEEEPDALEREAAALTALAATAVPAPRLVAWTATPPALLMTRRPGAHRLDVDAPGAVLALLDAIHTVDPGPLARWTYRGYHEEIELPPPSWWVDAAMWERAVGLGPPRYAPVAIHRDFHPGNVLWKGDAISGVVDWGNACLGPAAFDLAHYRVNVSTLVGQGATDAAFPGDPRWDIEAAFGYIDPWSEAARDAWVGPWPHIRADVARARVEEFVGRALAELG